MRDEPNWVYSEICDNCGDWFDPFESGDKKLCLKCKKEKEKMNELAIRENDVKLQSLNPDSVLQQIKQIQDLMNKAMKEDEHYGVIPGTKKPTLLKAGAEKLGFMFRLAPRFNIGDPIDLGNGHREWIVRCELIHIPTGKIWGEGVGSCSTMESKYRWRTGEVEFTGKPVPKEYWDNRDQKLIGGNGFRVKKNPETGQWEIVRAGKKVENDNIADVYNTVLKMAKKRAFVDAMLTATAASDIFTQDVEELKENMKKHEEKIEDAEIIDDNKQEPPKEENKKESKEVADGKLEIINKIHDAILKHVDNNFAEAEKELQRFTQFTGNDGNVVAGVKSTELMKDWSFRRVQVTWGKVKKEYGIK